MIGNCAQNITLEINNVSAICCVCGNDKFKKCHWIFKKPRTDQKLQCTLCGSQERHRVTKNVYDKHLNKNAKNILLLSIDPARYYLPDFTEISIYKEHNSLDLKNIDRPDETYDLIYCHHILEHIDNDDLAFFELCRILKYGGELCWSVPQTSKEKTIILDPETNCHGHYRTYGLDLAEKIKKWDNLSDVSTTCFSENDPVMNTEWDIFITKKMYI